MKFSTLKNIIGAIAVDSDDETSVCIVDSNRERIEIDSIQLKIRFNPDGKYENYVEILTSHFLEDEDE